MKKTYAYVKYVAPKLNRHGSFDSAAGNAICLGVTLNATEKQKYIYRQAEIEYPEDRFRIREKEGWRTMFGLTMTGEFGGETVNLNELLQEGAIQGRMFKPQGGTVEFTCLDDLTSGKPVPVEIGPEPPECPHCHGRKRVTAFVDCDDRSQSGIREIDCANCQGTGTVTKEHLERLARGKAMREDRLLRDASLRQESKRLGITVRELSDMEHGKLRAKGEVDHIKGIS